jgi:lipopolysaccharide/colanic/teichoic acid biosynthesis glycosyltransferase
MMTRFFDLLFSGLALVVLSPLLVPIAIVLRLTGEGYVFYTQERVGRGGRKFGLLKFATMLKDSPNMGSGHITLTGDPRVLPVGRFLRKTKINEMPQLINIFKGDMSIVGPRPLTERNFNYYAEEARHKIASVRPGLTGVGSIVFRDEERYLNNQPDPVAFYREHIAPYKAELELWYLEHRSLLLYFKLILLTALAVLCPRSVRVEKWLGGMPKPPEALA